MSFSDLRKKSGTSALADLTAKMEKMNQNQGGGYQNDDDRYWRHTPDKDGNASATIRFLPAPEGEDVPFVRLWDHFFKGPGGHYVENSLTTLGQDDPVSKFNSVLWKASDDKESPERKQASAQKRRLNYIANILVIKDPANPENEGKVFLYKFGKKIFNKIQAAMHPTDEEIEENNATPINPFDLWEGANLMLKVKKVAGYPNYDDSKFTAKKPAASSDDELEAIWRQEHKLQDLLDLKNFKSYDELKARLEKVLGHAIDDDGKPAARKKAVDSDFAATPAFKERAAPEAKEDRAPWDDESTTTGDVGMSEDEDEFFKNLGA